MGEIIVRKMNVFGQEVWKYSGEKIDSGDTWVCLEAIFQSSDVDIGHAVFRHGDLFTEWFFTDRWYNIFQVQDVDSGQLKGWYCNITRPALISEVAVQADDLALDVFVTPMGELHLMDEDEFTALNLIPSERMAALHAVETLRQAVLERSHPFNQIDRIMPNN